MRTKTLLAAAAAALLLLPLACGPSKGLADYRLLMERNVCKKMRGDVLFYAIFIDTKNTRTWTDEEVRASVDSIKYAAQWLEQQAKTNGVPLRVKVSYLSSVRTVQKDLPNKTLMATIGGTGNENGVKALNKWADDVAKTAGGKMENKANPGDTIPVISNPKTCERLIAKLRDEHKVESVCLFFVLNSMVKEDGAVVMNRGSNKDVEYIVTSYNTSALYSFLALEEFGAIDFFSMPPETESYKIAQQNFPSDVMVNPFKKLGSLTVSPFTQYMIGWTKQVDKKYEVLFYPPKTASGGINMR
ncbi:MAG: hypothetical protein AB1458_01820 [Bacteroidota bacterium]